MRKASILTYAFVGIPALRVKVSPGDVSLAVCDHRKHLDVIAPFFIDLRKKKSGKYVCEECDRKDRGREYEDRASLLADHVFEPFLEWCNENLREDRLDRWWSTKHSRVVLLPLFAPSRRHGAWNEDAAKLARPQTDETM